MIIDIKKLNYEMVSKSVLIGWILAFILRNIRE